MTISTLPAVSMIGLVDSEQFKHLLAELANGGNNPKHRRALVREVREAIKACAEAQRQACVAELHGMRWIPTDEALPAPYEEVRILLDGVPRIARLNHASAYFQLATFLDNTKAQYVASFDRVAGWMPLPTDTAPAAVLQVGALMANTMFNIGQRPGTTIDGQTAESMRDMQRQWDDAVRAMKGTGK